MKLKLYLLFILFSLFLLSCGTSTEDVTNQTKTDIENYLNENFKEYNIKIDSINLKKTDEKYTGIVTVMYKEEKTEFPITVTLKENNYNYDFVLLPMRIKGIAEGAAKKLLEETINKDNWAKENDLEVKSISFYPGTENSYEGLVTFIHASKEHNVGITFRYDKNGGYMYSLEDSAFDFLF